MAGGTTHVRPNDERDGFEIRIRSRLGISYYTEAVVYDNNEPHHNGLDEDEVPIEEEPNIIVDNVQHFNPAEPEVQVVYMELHGQVQPQNQN